jgi:hypothetical protein
LRPVLLVEGLDYFLEFAVEVDLIEKLVESIIERVSRPTAEFISSNPERILLLPFPFPKCHR